MHAPGGFQENCDWTGYLAAHHFLFAHATAYHIYDSEFKSTQKGDGFNFRMPKTIYQRIRMIVYTMLISFTCDPSNDSILAEQNTRFHSYIYEFADES